MAGIAPDITFAQNAGAVAAPPQSHIILFALKGLRLVDSPAKLDTAGKVPQGVTIDGPQILYSPAVYRQLQQFIGRPFSRATMQSITAVVAAWYRAHNRPFVDVSFPDQDISSFKVQAVVTEYRLGHVRVSGNNWFGGWLLRSQLSLSPGDRIDSKLLGDDLTWINQNSYRQVQAVAEKSDIDGATDLELRTTDRFPWHFSAGYDDSGTPVTERGRWSFGIDWGDAFFLDQDLSYQFSSSDDFWLHPQGVPVESGRATFEGHQASWSIPLPWRDRLVFFGNYNEQRPDLGPFFSQLGTSWQASARYVVQLPSSTAFTQELQIGFDYKHTNNNLSFGGSSISHTPTEIDQFPLTYSAALDDTYGRTVFLGELVLSPGGLTAQNTDVAFQPSATQIGVPDAKARYLYGDANITRITRLPLDASWILRLQSQLASSNLLQSEQLGLGGVESIRGYDERTASASQGVLLSNELRSPPVGVIDKLFGTASGDQIQFDAFWDYGHVLEKTSTAGAMNNATLASLGAGVHYVLGRFVDIRFEYGWQLRKAPGADARGSEPYLSVVIGY
jgi:hemolysin activation/secretion protein